MAPTSGSPKVSFTGPQIGTPVRAPKTAELIAGHLRRQIVRGELQPGRTLPPEIQLMEQYGVSRPTLREAFRILEAEALISVRRGSRGGAQVIAPEVAVAARYVGLLLQIQGTTINDVYEARMITEPPCARLLVERHTEDDLAKLTEVVEQLKAEVHSSKPFVPDPDTWSRLTYRFHELILQGSGNKTLAIQGAVLADIVATHLRTKIARGYDDEPSERFQRVIRSFTKFIGIVKTGDAAAAEKHWLSHMEAAAQFLLKDDLKTKPVVDLFS
ncbi:FadR/GntR family transcriptional regulator [Nocardioides sp. cx-173]|uniref:FadR/GntR family transcriptional regulator n=1 Tax=Nocardioides sp. cx-173 TaxID=2898796 RepID=UPI001E38E0F3|nr:FadR/GntR family transcriptional regulator [Nocardioides sp. cx-173]MCD4524273.1 FadR family transcriptional regulator [Nocardioides sp. cx-173]UGB41665.1 FadR family transcriptional regulator [Nocardioides sp. cx-173]